MVAEGFGTLANKHSIVITFEMSTPRICLGTNHYLQFAFVDRKNKRVLHVPAAKQLAWLEYEYSV